MKSTGSTTASAGWRINKRWSSLEAPASGLAMLMAVFTVAPAAQPATENEMKTNQKAALADAPVTRSGRDIQPTLTLRVYNYAHLDPGLLTSAEEVATSILKNAGAVTVWVECPLSSADFERYPGCQQGMQTTDFVIRLLPASMASKVPVSNEPLGFAQHCPDSERACVANIFYAKVDELALLEGRGSARILGHAMAHELGHLLLGENAHSRSGVMRGVWCREDLRFMSWSELNFTLRQSDQIRASLLRRAKLEVCSDSESASKQDSDSR
jgi:hypothetical protein